MKKLLVSCLLAMLCTGTFAQTSTGNFALGGSLSLFSGSNDYRSSESKGSMYSLSPSVGYFVSDGLELGLNTRISYGSNTNRSEGADTEYRENTFGFGIGPYLTKYISITEKLHFTASGGLGYENSRTKNPDIDEKLISTTTGFYVAAMPGLTYFATQKLGFSVAIGNIGYSRSTEVQEQTEPKRETEYSGFDFNFSPVSTSIGIRYFITR